MTTRHPLTEARDGRTPADSSAQAEAGARPFFRAFATALLATGAFAAWLGWRVGGDRVVLYVSDAGTVLAPLVASVACFRAGRRHERRLRVFWWMLAAACVAWLCGEVIWVAYDLAGSGGPPIPSWADVGYLAFIPLAVGALLYHPGLRGRGTRKTRFLIDGLSIAVALLFLSWTTVLGPLWRSSDLTTLGGVVTLAYPFGDVIVGFFVMLTLRRMGTADRLELWCLLAGLIAMALADSAYTYVVEVAHYTSGNLLDTGWFAGFLGIALGASASNPGHFSRRAESSRPALPSLVAPLLPMLIALGAAGVSINLKHRPDTVALTMLFALILLALVRQALLVLDVVMARGVERQGNLVDRMARATLGRSISDEDGNRTPRVQPPEGSRK